MAMVQPEKLKSFFKMLRELGSLNTWCIQRRNVKAELRCQPQTKKARPEALMRGLRSTYGERRSVNCLIGQLFRISQHQYESVRTYSHRLFQAFEALTDRQRALSETPFSKSILRDQFVENLSDRILRRDLRERLLDRPETEFLALRDMAIRWAQDEDVAPQVNVTCREIKIEGQLAALSKQVEELAAQIVLLQLSGPQNYSCPHCNNHQPDHISSNVRQISSQPGRQPNRTLHHKRPATKNRKCYTCGKPGHLARNCRLQNRFQGQRKKPGKQAHQQHPSRSNCSNRGSQDHFTRACPDVTAALNHVQVASVEQPQAVQLQPAPKPTELSVEVPQNPRRSNTVPDSLVRRSQPAVAEMMSIHTEVASSDTSGNHAEG
uniref:CCHC-type domain-containing protein n=1 Tax=Biomphalaria glabrata TaxID=6526 RepID=A0A2C9L7U9_BIOGL